MQIRHFLPRYATTQTMCCLTFYLRRQSRCTPCNLECTTEFSQRQTTGWVELFLLACYILITRVYECILPCIRGVYPYTLVAQMRHLRNWGGKAFWVLGGKELKI